jgi:hypothetical protein
MAKFTDEQIEALLTPETRWLVMPDGSTRELTYSHLIWSVVYDGLIDDGYTDADFITHADMPGWEKPNLPFATRFECVIVDLHNRLVDERRQRT